MRFRLAFSLFLVATIILPILPIKSVEGGDSGLTSTNSLAFAGTVNVDDSSFFAQGRYWLFYVTGTCVYLGRNDNCIMFSSSVDGLNWAAPTNTTFPSSGGNLANPGFGVNNNSSMVFVAETVTTSSPLTDTALYVRYGSLTTGGLVSSWTSTRVANQTSTADGIGATVYDVKLSSKGRLFVSYSLASNTPSDPTNFDYIATSTDTSISAWTTSSIVTSKETYGQILAPLANGNVYAVSTTTGGLVNGTLWTPSGGWGTPENVYQQSSGNKAPGGVFADYASNPYIFVRDGGTLNLMFCSRSTDLGGKVSWGCIIIANTSSSQAYRVSFSQDLGQFVIVLLASNTSWTWFTLPLKTNIPSSQAQIALITSTFTVGTNGAVLDYGTTPIGGSPPVVSKGQFTDFYWIEGNGHIYNIQIIVSPSGGACIGTTCAGSTGGSGLGGFFGFNTTSVCPLGFLNSTIVNLIAGCYNLPAQLFGSSVPYLVGGFIGLTLLSSSFSRQHEVSPLLVGRKRSKRLRWRRVKKPDLRRSLI